MMLHIGDDFLKRMFQYSQKKSGTHQGPWFLSALLSAACFLCCEQPPAGLVFIYFMKVSSETRLLYNLNTRGRLQWTAEENETDEIRPTGNKGVEKESAVLLFSFQNKQWHKAWQNKCYLNKGRTFFIKAPVYN